MNLRKAAQQALEALELAGMSHNVMLMSDPPQDAWKARAVNWKLAKAINALRAALADTASQEFRQVEPVAWMWRFEPADGAAFTTKKPEASIRDGVDYIPLYTAPPKREPLTYEEATVLTADCLWSDMMKFVRAIERAHGIGDAK